MNISTIFRRNMRNLMEESGVITQSHLSRITGVTQPHLSVLASGKKTPSIETLATIAEGLRVEPWRLLAPTTMTPDVIRILAVVQRLPERQQRAVLQMAESLLVSGH